MIYRWLIDQLSNSKRMAGVTGVFLFLFLFFFAPSWISSPSDFWVSSAGIVILALGGATVYFIKQSLNDQ